MKYNLAQLNIAKLKAPLDHPSIHGFVSRLDEINAIAEQSSGFIWRFVEEGSNSAVNISIFDDPMLIVNMSVWSDLETLKNFIYKTDHVQVYLKKDLWFHKMDSHHMVLWWVEEGKIPTPGEAKERLQHLQDNGPSQFAFTFKEFFEAPNKLK